MEKVILKSIPKGEVKEFSFEHAKRIFEVQKAAPPKSWALNDPNYELKNGLIVKIAPAKTADLEPKIEEKEED